MGSSGLGRYGIYQGETLSLRAGRPIAETAGPSRRIERSIQATFWQTSASKLKEVALARPKLDIIRKFVLVESDALLREDFLANFCQSCRESGQNQGQRREVENQKILVAQGFSFSGFPGAPAPAPLLAGRRRFDPRSPAPLFPQF